MSTSKLEYIAWTAISPPVAAFQTRIEDDFEALSMDAPCGRVLTAVRHNRPAKSDRLLEAGRDLFRIRSVKTLFLLGGMQLNADESALTNPNMRALIDDDDDDFWFGFGVEYFTTETNRPLGLPLVVIPQVPITVRLLRVSTRNHRRASGCLSVVSMWKASTSKWLPPVGIPDSPKAPTGRATKLWLLR